MEEGEQRRMESRSAASSSAPNGLAAAEVGAEDGAPEVAVAGSDILGFFNGLRMEM